MKVNADFVMGTVWGIVCLAACIFGVMLVLSSTPMSVALGVTIVVVDVLVYLGKAIS